MLKKRIKGDDPQCQGGDPEFCDTRFDRHPDLPKSRQKSRYLAVHAPLGGYVLPFQRESSYGRTTHTTSWTTSCRVPPLRSGSRDRQAVLTKRGLSPQHIQAEGARSTADRRRHIRYAIVRRQARHGAAATKKNPYRDALQGCPSATHPSPIRSGTMTIGHGDR